MHTGPPSGTRLGRKQIRGRKFFSRFQWNESIATQMENVFQLYIPMKGHRLLGTDILFVCLN